MFLECSSYFSRMHLSIPYIVVKFQTPNYNIFRDMNYFLVTFGQVQTPDNRHQTESDAYEPTVQSAQVGSKTNKDK